MSEEPFRSRQGDVAAAVQAAIAAGYKATRIRITPSGEIIIDLDILKGTRAECRALLQPQTSTDSCSRHFRNWRGSPVEVPSTPSPAQGISSPGAPYAVAAPSETGDMPARPFILSEVIDAYYADVSFRALAVTTQKMRRAILKRLGADYGDRFFCNLRRSDFAAVLSSKTPVAAKNWLKTFRAFVRFAIAAGYRDDDLTEGIKTVRVPTAEIHSWTEGEIAQFEARFPIGTRARLAMALFLYTAQRRADVVRMGPRQLQHGTLTVKQGKTALTLEIPIHPALAETLAATTHNHPTFLATASGKPFSNAGFGNLFRDWCRAAGLPEHCSSHGLRKAACRRLAEAGCSEHQIAAISGHRSLYEIQRYTRRVRQLRLAQDAMASVISAFPAKNA